MYIQMANEYVGNAQHEKSSAKNANGNHSELPLMPSYSGYSQKGKQMLMEVQRGHSHCY